MFLFILIMLVAAALVLWILYKPRYIEYKRRKIQSEPFPHAWRKIIQRHVPYFRVMPVDLQLQLKDKIKVFLREKEFVGCEGVQITDEIRITIAAQACLLILNRKTDFYPNLQSILVYPAAFITHHPQRDGMVVREQRRVLSGESWGHGKVVLSWNDTIEGAASPDDGRNVVIHEFAHQLDQETGVANGAPYFSNSIDPQKWSEVLNTEFEILRTRTQQGIPSLLDSYGATNPGEFFAVATEVFFEQPEALSELHGSLYEQLKGYYQVDPINWN